MSRTVWRMLRELGWIAAHALTLLIAGCSDEPGPVGPNDVTVTVTGTVGVPGAWLTGTTVELGSRSRSLVPPVWDRTFDEAAATSSGSYALQGVLDRIFECPGTYVRATFDLPPFHLLLDPVDAGRVCESQEVDFQVHFPVRRSIVAAMGEILWSDASAAQGVNVVLATSGEPLDATKTDSNGEYRVDAAVLDAICDPDSEFAGETWLRVADEEGSPLAYSRPLVCGVNQVDLVLAYLP